MDVVGHAELPVRAVDPGNPYRRPPSPIYPPVAVSPSQSPPRPPPLLSADRADGVSSPMSIDDEDVDPAVAAAATTTIGIATTGAVGDSLYAPPPLPPSSSSPRDDTRGALADDCKDAGQPTVGYDEQSFVDLPTAVRQTDDILPPLLDSDHGGGDGIEVTNPVFLLIATQCDPLVMYDAGLSQSESVRRSKDHLTGLTIVALERSHHRVVYSGLCLRRRWTPMPKSEFDANLGRIVFRDRFCNQRNLYNLIPEWVSGSQNGSVVRNNHNNGGDAANGHPHHRPQRDQIVAPVDGGASSSASSSPWPTRVLPRGSKLLHSRYSWLSVPDRRPDQLEPPQPDQLEPQPANRQTRTELPDPRSTDEESDHVNSLSRYRDLYAELLKFVDSWCGRSPLPSLDVDARRDAAAAAEPTPIARVYHKLPRNMLWLLDDLTAASVAIRSAARLAFQSLQHVNAKRVGISYHCVSRVNHNSSLCEVCLVDTIAPQVLNRLPFPPSTAVVARRRPRRRRRSHGSAAAAPPGAVAGSSPRSLSGVAPLDDSRPSPLLSGVSKSTIRKPARRRRRGGRGGNRKGGCAPAVTPSSGSGTAAIPNVDDVAPQPPPPSGTMTDHDQCSPMDHDQCSPMDHDQCSPVDHEQRPREDICGGGGGGGGNTDNEEDEDDGNGSVLSSSPTRRRHYKFETERELNVRGGLWSDEI